jgi:hypothetical protein
MRPRRHLRTPLRDVDSRFVAEMGSRLVLLLDMTYFLLYLLLFRSSARYFQTISQVVSFCVLTALFRRFIETFSRKELSNHK